MQLENLIKIFQLEILRITYYVYYFDYFNTTSIVRKHTIYFLEGMSGTSNSLTCASTSCLLLSLMTAWLGTLGSSISNSINPVNHNYQ